MVQASNQKKRNGIKKYISTFNQFKEFEGKKYTGMRIGRTHKWYYNKGYWKEKKSHPINGNLDIMLQKEEQGMLQKVQVFLSEQSTIGTSLPTKM